MPRFLPRFLPHFLPHLTKLLLISGVLLWPGVAAAEVVWTLSKKAGRAYLQGFSSVVEADSEFWAHCQADGSIQIGAGADSHVGKGRGETVTLTFTSGGATAKLAGTSRESQNFQMTSGMNCAPRSRAPIRCSSVFAPESRLR